MSDEHVPGVGAALGEAGGCPTIEWNGRRWKIGHPIQRAKAILEDLVTAAAVEQVERLRAVLSPERFAEKETQFFNLLGAKNWATWGSGWAQTLNAPTTRHLFSMSLLKVHQPDATEDDLFGLMGERGTALQAALVRVAPDFLDLLAASFPGPPDMRAAVKAQMAAALLMPDAPSA